MPDLFPSVYPTITSTTVDTQISFGRSFLFDFDAGEFVLTPAGRFVQTDDIAAWAEWCKKALMTARYRFLVYGRNYGQEFDSFIGHGLTKEAVESEIKRMAVECLKANPRTAAVTDFVFTWGTDSADTVIFTCKITNILGESSNLQGSAVIG